MSLVSEAVIGLIVTVAGELLGPFSGPGSVEPRPAEGEWKASLGMVSLFLALLAVLIALGASIDLLEGNGSWWAYLLGVVAAALFWLPVRLGRRTLVVTSRGHLWAWTAILVGALGVAWCLGVVLWAQFETLLG